VNPQSLRFKLSWTHGLVISIFIVLMGYVRYQTVSYRSIRSFDENLQSDGEFAASHFRLSDQGFAWSLEDLAPADIVTLEGLRPYIIVTDSGGNVLWKDFHSRYVQQLLRSGGFDEILRKRSERIRTVTSQGTTYRLVSLPLKGNSGSPLTLHLARPMDSLQGVLDEYLNIYLYSVPLILAISVTLGWYLAGRALTPFEDVARTAERITSMNLNTQISMERREAEIQRLVLAFNAMVRRLNDSFQQMRKFNADVAHELRTPLSILQGENEVALRDPDLPEDVRALLVSNLEELHRLTQIVKDLLILSEADAGSQILAKKPTSLKLLLEDLVEQMRVLAIDRGIEIDLTGLQDVVLEVDPLWFRRALLNLLDNAIKYSKDGGRIEVRTLIVDRRVNLVIRDEGIGIGPQDLPHIFDRLYRADPARNRSSGGTGLGLALVRWIVESHHGSIRVASEVDRGSTFEISLPAVPLTAAAADPIAPADSKVPKREL
jgi:heavy metal sensor kinase